MSYNIRIQVYVYLWVLIEKLYATPNFSIHQIHQQTVLNGPLNNKKTWSFNFFLKKYNTTFSYFNFQIL